MDLNQDRSKIRELSYACIFDKKSPMSARVACTVLYTVLRLGEVIDWWFPVK